MQKIYYVTRDLKPTDNMHYAADVVDGAIVPDMDTLLARKGLIVSDTFARDIRQNYGRDAVSSFTVPNLWGSEYRSVVRDERDGLCIIRYYTKA